MKKFQLSKTFILNQNYKIKIFITIKQVKLLSAVKLLQNFCKIKESISNGLVQNDSKVITCKLKHLELDFSQLKFDLTICSVI